MFQNFWIRLGNFLIWESDSCLDSGYNHQSNLNLPMLLFKKWPHRLLLLPKLKSDSRSVFSQIFDSGSASERKLQNLAGINSGTLDLAPPLQTTRLAEYFEPLNSSLLLSTPELRLCKAMCDPVVLAWISWFRLDVKVLFTNFVDFRS